MRVRTPAWMIAACGLAAAIHAQETPYAGLAEREIKALSPEKIAAYRAGEGMGLAMAAGLNSHPGPKHVLELADELALDAGQRRKTEQIYRTMHRSAVRLGIRIVERERALDARFASGELEDDFLRGSLLQIGELKAQLRYQHLRAHLLMRQVLSAEQVKTYDRLRGYGSGEEPAQHGHGDHHE